MRGSGAGGFLIFIPLLVIFVIVMLKVPAVQKWTIFLIFWGFILLIAAAILKRLF